MEEILAPDWASKYAEQCYWNEVIWNSNAKEVVKKVKVKMNQQLEISGVEPQRLQYCS